MTDRKGWDCVVVQQAAGYWWWNAWNAHSATELTGTAGTLGEARTALERAISVIGPPAPYLDPPRGRRR